MFCPSCGKSIPDEGKFCLHCGAPLPDQANDTSLRATPPIALKIQGFTLIGPTETRKEFLFGTHVGRGFKWAISLLDSDNQQTTSDGKLIVVLRCGMASYDLTTAKVYRPTIKEAHRVITSSEGLWRRELDVSKGHFKWLTYTNSQTGAKFRNLVYEYSQTSPLLFLYIDMAVELHCWFITPDGRCIYKPSEDYWRWKA